jgi:hypothetical protein
VGWRAVSDHACSNRPWRAGDTAEIGEPTDPGWKAVKVMAVADGYAMVRIPYCVPFVAVLRDLRRHEDNHPRPS